MDYIQVQPLGSQEQIKDFHYAVKKPKKYKDLEKKNTPGPGFSKGG